MTGKEPQIAFRTSSYSLNYLLFNSNLDSGGSVYIYDRVGVQTRHEKSEKI